ncbi:ABC transporter permease [Halarchaeum sp. CBA1220]|uniref:ABC transporter permease n=1 Tax=Halarchaeum sp. CBA1220 TaxID=1853682 RepID=UPI000F3A82CA|nr:ABC transporter permease [Halarchaeum sp. CBA1220]QLC34448.1 ABC transporter permease [Halarchaeum sp. CBA1220]
MSARDRARAALERLVRASGFERFLISASALLLSIAIGFVIVLVAGRMTSCSTAATTYVGVGFCYDPIGVYEKLFFGAFGDFLADPLNGNVATTLAETTVLLFTGVAVALAFRAGVFNIGAQGQLVLGALATAVVVGAVAPLVAGFGVATTVVLVTFGLLVGALTGGAYGALPGALKAYADANEVITTIMLNFVATSVALFLVGDPNWFKDTESVANQTVPLPDVALFPTALFRARDDFSLIALGVGLLTLVGVWLLLTRTSFGYDLRTSGLQAQAAEYGGVDAKRTIVSSMALSGALAGVGGAVYVLMILGNFQTGVPSYGFDGITVSILAGNNPLGVAAAALLFGVLKSGSIVVQVGSNVPPELVGVLRGLIILFVAMPEFFRMIGRRVVGPVAGDGAPMATDGGVGGGDDE